MLPLSDCLKLPTEYTLLFLNLICCFSVIENLRATVYTMTNDLQKTMQSTTSPDPS